VNAAMESLPVIAGVLISLLTGKLVFRFFFEDAAGFWDCFRFSLRPDLFSLLKGEWLEDQFKSMKLSLFLIVMGGAGSLVFFGLEEWLHSPNPPRSIEMPAEMPE
jgi:hypothetical protein